VPTGGADKAVPRGDDAADRFRALTPARVDGVPDGADAARAGRLSSVVCRPAIRDQGGIKRTLLANSSDRLTDLAPAPDL
jgi:hypothetical protein